MAKILGGAEVAASLIASAQKDASALAAHGIVPCLAIVRVGAREDGISYERSAVKSCEKAGIRVRCERFPEDVTQEALEQAVESLNADASVHGVLLLCPLPKHLREDRLRALLAPEKDVDGITAASMASVYAGAGAGYAPCTAQACIALLKHYGVPLAGRRAAVIGRSTVVGRPIAMLLLAENASVTVCHSHSEKLAALCREADILIAAAGKANFVGRDFVRAGQTVLDVGIHVGADSALCGDVRFDEVAPIADGVTPVPGGIGAVTNAVLIEHVTEAAKKAMK